MQLEEISAPDFNIEVANGPDVQLADLWREQHLLLWFSRGLICPFCRRQMLQFEQIQHILRQNNTRALQITPTELQTARRMLEFFPVSWIYGCDPSGRVAAAYLAQVEVPVLARMAGAVRKATHAWGLLVKHPGEPHAEVLPAVQAAGDQPAIDGGMVLIDRTGRVRFRQPSGKLALLPSNEQLIKLVQHVAASDS